MNTDKRKGNRPRRPRISRSNLSKNDNSPARDNRLEETSFKDEKRNNLLTFDRDFQSGKRQSFRSGSHQEMDSRGEKRFRNTYRKKE